jgi:hypothetical protein
MGLINNQGTEQYEATRKRGFFMHYFEKKLKLWERGNTYGIGIKKGREIS